MAGSHADALETALLDHVYGGPSYTRPSSVFLALFTVGPADDGSGTEVDTADWTNYARAEIVNNNTNFPAATSPGGLGTKANGTDIDLGTAATTGNITLTGWALMDADAPGGNMMDWGTYASPQIVQDGDPVKVLTGSLTLTSD